MTTATATLPLVFVLLVLLGLTQAFAPTTGLVGPASKELQQRSSPSTRRTSSSSSSLAVVDPQFAAELSTARAAFGLCFFGAAGTAALGRDAIPFVWKKFQATRALGGQGPVSGTSSETLGLSLVATGYPEDIRVQDLQDVIYSNWTVGEMVEQFPCETAMAGYLSYECFRQANEGKNPLATRAVFESLAVGSDLVTPNKAQAALEAYQGDLSLIKDNLTKTKVLGFSAVFILVVLLGLADWFAVYHLYKGFFPEWP